MFYWETWEIPLWDWCVIKDHEIHKKIGIKNKISNLNLSVKQFIESVEYNKINAVTTKAKHILLLNNELVKVALKIKGVEFPGIYSEMHNQMHEKIAEGLKYQRRKSRYFSYIVSRLKSFRIFPKMFDVIEVESLLEEGKEIKGYLDKSWDTLESEIIERGLIKAEESPIFNLNFTYRSSEGRKTVLSSAWKSVTITVSVCSSELSLTIKNNSSPDTSYLYFKDSSSFTDENTSAVIKDSIPTVILKGIKEDEKVHFNFYVVEMTDQMNAKIKEVRKKAKEELLKQLDTFADD
jgi:hypothetical protein